MDERTRHALLQLLGKAMSDISEECFYAGWLGGTEDEVPELCRRAIETDQPQVWGQGTITPDQAIGLNYIAEQLGYWAIWTDTGFEPFPE